MLNPGDIPLVRVVLGRIEARMADPRSLRGLSEPEADLMSAVTAKGIIDSGGHVYWFEGMGRAETLRAATAFERMGVTSAAEAMRHCLGAFPGGSPSRKYVKEHRQELMEAFSRSDHVVQGLDFYAVAAAYIWSRRSHLLLADPGLKKVAPTLRDQ
jgi:hypothetical protein